MQVLKNQLTLEWKLLPTREYQIMYLNNLKQVKEYLKE